MFYTKCVVATRGRVENAAVAAFRSDTIRCKGLTGFNNRCGTTY